MTLFLAIVIGILVLGLLGCVGFVCWAAKCVWRESVSRSRSADETIGKNLPVIMQTAMAVSDRVDTRARERVRIINANIGTPQAADEPPTAAAPVGEMPPIYMSHTDMEQRELDREAQRLTREGADDPRDLGIGQSDLTPPSVRQEAL